jgi:hypothetical protein
MYERLIIKKNDERLLTFNISLKLRKIPIYKNFASELDYAKNAKNR